MNELRFEGVTFMKSECVKMSREDFISRHLDVFWMDRKEATRGKMLGKAYDLMAPPVKADT
ncbi:MAG: hypothetical protein NC421_07545 [Lachnospiraceae bacterium]|nr:hypothetical protein [Lachnospiraceae bacterium]